VEPMSTVDAGSNGECGSGFGFGEPILAKMMRSEVEVWFGP